jgi:hypothetical protein
MERSWFRSKQEAPGLDLGERSLCAIPLSGRDRTLTPFIRGPGQRDGQARENPGKVI